MTKQELLDRIEHVIYKGSAAVQSAPTPSQGGAIARSMINIDPDISWVKPDLAAVFRTAGLNLLNSLYGADHAMYVDFDAATKDQNVVGSYKRALAIITVAREEVQKDWLQNARALIAADIFANILEMADYLLAEGYKDAAAVLIGGSLEGHLKNLARRHGVDTHYNDNAGAQKPRKAESLNQDLHKADAYKLGDQKQITAWLDLRNNAAHGEYNKYSAAEVRLMSQGVQNFIVRVPA